MVEESMTMRLQKLWRWNRMMSSRFIRNRREALESGDQKTGTKTRTKSQTIGTVSEYINKMFKFSGFKKLNKNREDTGDKDVVSYSTKDDDVVRLAPLSL